MEGIVWNKPETNSLHAYMAARNEAIINLRVLAVLIVVIGHCIIIFDPAWSRPMGYESLYPSGFLVSVKRLINLFQMELFFSISGFCFYYSIHKVSDFGHFVLNKACRLIIPFIATGMLWQIPLRAIARYNGFADKNILQIWEAFFTLKDCGHLWFLPVLFFLFLISYLLLKTHRKAIWVVPFIAVGLYALYVRLPGDFQISNIAKYLIFFLLAAWLSADMQLCEQSVPKKIKEQYEKWGLPTQFDALKVSELLSYMKKDKKTMGMQLNFVLLEEIGSSILVHNINPADVEKVLYEKGRKRNAVSYY